MTNGNDRLDRVERILEEMAVDKQETARYLRETSIHLGETSIRLGETSLRLGEMAARQQYHDEAFERHDAEMKVIREAIAADAENIRALARIAELHHERMNRLEGDTQP